MKNLSRRALIPLGPKAAPRARAMSCYVLVIALVFIVLQWGNGRVSAGELDKRGIEKYFPAPLLVGEKDGKLAIWPIFKPPGSPVDVVPSIDVQGRTVWPFGQTGADAAGKPILMGYAFESTDIAPVPGYSGKVINMLIAIDTKGKFLDVRLLTHQEPLFVGGLGDKLMGDFAGQYRGLSVKQTMRLVNESQLGTNAGKAAPPGVAQLRGISRGTVTVELMDKSIMQSAIKIAGSKLGIVGSVDPEKLAKLRADFYEPSDWDGLSKAGLIQGALFKQNEIEKAFEGTRAANQGGPSSFQSDDTAIEFRIALLSLPQVGRNLLDEAGYKKIEFNLKNGMHSLLVVSRGPYSFIGDDFVIAGGLNRLVLKQGESEIELKDFVYDHGLKLPPGFDRSNAKVVQIAGYAGLDPARPLELRYRVKRNYGTFNRQGFEGLYPFTYNIPKAFVIPAPVPEPAWKNAWVNQKINVTILITGLLILSAALVGQRWLVKAASSRPLQSSPPLNSQSLNSQSLKSLPLSTQAKSSKRLEWFRVTFLVFTLGFVGWYGQGQLSIVNITGVIESLVAGNGLGYLLFDPMSLTLWVFVIASLFIWGRGTFCGWLCPFGALQELISKMVKVTTGFKGIRLHTRTDARLKWVKYVVLAGVLLTALIAPQVTSTAAEVEPFKTSISLYFVRSWPYVLWAIACLSLSVLVYRGYCRYICPLGAALAVLGRVRVFNWIPRRSECGTPCQTCRHRCEYQAIEPQGKVAYQECFQCLDCVEIHDSDEKCAPLISEKRRAQRVIPIVADPILTDPVAPESLAASVSGSFTASSVSRVRG
jgi:NosR/NirI family transcriptional regulator, nitrous oxide reductase regulator